MLPAHTFLNMNITDSFCLTLTKKKRMNWCFCENNLNIHENDVMFAGGVVFVFRWKYDNVIFDCFWHNIQGVENLMDADCIAGTYVIRGEEQFYNP